MIILPEKVSTKKEVLKIVRKGKKADMICVCIDRGFSVNFNQKELQKIINEFEKIKEKCQNNK